PQDFKANEYDLHEILGPMREAVTDRVINQTYAKNRMLAGLSGDFGAKAHELGADWQKSLRENVDNATLLDPDKSEPGQPTYMHFTRGKLIALAIHFGNESNFNKAVKGWGWEPSQAF